MTGIAVSRTVSRFQGINCYVPKMAFAADLINGQPSFFHLGTPAASDDDLIAATIDSDAVATTVESYAGVWTCDSPYGRTLIFTPSGNPGNSYAIDVYGEDYLGQPMVERFTGASGSTAILYGKKAFYRVNKTVIVTAASNAITTKLGTGTRLGLPYKGDVVWAKENDILVPVYNRTQTFRVNMAAAQVVAGGSLYVRAPFPGYVETLRAMPSGGGSTTNAATTVELGNTAIVGLTVTADQDTATMVTDTPTTVGYNANNRFAKDDLIEIVHAATTSGGATSFELDLTPTQFINPVLTDPQTTTTGDPRGTYDPLTAPASYDVVIGLLGDTSYNSSGNGGLHGIKHVIS